MKYLYPSNNITLPIGYSVFAFSCISFLVDQSKGLFHARSKKIDVFCYLFFFPKMLCGPIVRFVPFNKQLNSCLPPTKTDVYKAFKIVVYASFCKFCVADNLSWIVSSQTSGINAWCCTIIFAIQLYLDFYAYSNFAIAFALLIGIDLPVSFDSPYRASSFHTFWRKWNITVSEWLKDYIYIPLGGSKSVSQIRANTNVFITFLVSGLWHGASVPFLLWGAIHGSLVIIERNFINKYAMPRMISIIYNVFVVMVVILLWQLFRFHDLNELTSYVDSLFISQSADFRIIAYTIFAILIMCLLDVQNIKRLFLAQSNEKDFIYKEVSVVCVILFFVILFHSQPNIDFFYFKF
jgi:alginate O-acetyltransferase complex protein AlgI